jgi:23S rRNA pseudouridine2605 synthase
LNPKLKRKNSGRHIGLARVLSKLGFCSRSQAAELIRAGRVRLNGVVRRDPEAPVFSDRIEVDNQRVASAEKIYLMMNKPRGLVTTASDEKGRSTIYDVLKSEERPLPWLAAVGRLDKASEGLLLITNDTEWGARIAAPETHLEKTYHVQIGRIIGRQDFEKMLRGIQTENGEVLRLRRACLLRSGQKNCWLEIVLDEGKNRHIRRIFEAMNIEVLRLVRVGIGPIELGTLPKGEFRCLNTEEKKQLDRAMSRSPRND